MIPFLGMASAPVIKNDPTRPDSIVNITNEKEESEKSKNKSLKLQQTRISGNEKSAVINNTFVKEGDSIRGMKIQHIYSDRVELLSNGGVKVLSLTNAINIKETSR